MKFTKNLKHILIITIITFFVVMISNYLFGTVKDNKERYINSIIYRIDSPFLNILYKHPLDSSGKVVVIPIDSKFMSQIQGGRDFGTSNGTFTIPKSYYKYWVEVLEEAGVKAIGFDIIFSNRDDFESDFADTMRKYNNIVIATGTPDPNGLCTVDEVATSIGVVSCDGLPRSVYSGTTLGFVGANSNAHYMSTYVDNIRKNLFPDTVIETFSIALYRKYINYTGAILPPDLSRNIYTVGDRLVPLGEKNQMMLNTFFTGSQGYYIDKQYRDGRLGKNKNGEAKVGVFSLSDNKAYMKSLFAGKIVLIGEAGDILHDDIESPIEFTKMIKINGDIRNESYKRMAGVELHANMLDGLIQNSLLKNLNSTLSFVIILFLILVLVSISIEINSILSGIFTLFIIILTIFTGRYLYGHERVVIDIIAFFFASAFPWIITYIYKFFVIDQEKRFLKQAFAHYIDPTVVSDIAENASDIVLGGENRDLSVLFSDIAGFTTISEKLPPKELFNLMSSYLSQMTDILIQNGGTLDKYIGDAVMGFFGAPIHEADHAIRSCRTAVAMRAALPGFNAELIKNGKEPIDFRVGIASGEVMVGNIGSRDRFNYTVLGDTVNLASRLEATSKEYGTRVIISESTYLAVKDYFFVRKLDLIAVKGKHEGVGIYELISDIGDSTIDRKKYERYELALALYFAGKYEEAGKAFEANMQDDPPSKAMMLRCADLIKGVVKLENGVFVMTHK